MIKTFFNNQNSQEQQLYIDLLTITGSLSNLFSDNESPFLYYRAMENIFCKAFNAQNLSRGDVSADASIDKIGIGLKTFLHANGKTYQKVAEFNRESYLLKDISDEEIVYKVAEMRNERIEITKRLYELNEMMYHLVTRDKYKMSIFEEHMDNIKINSIKVRKRKNANIIHFTDGINDYSFSKSKSTLLKRFYTEDIKLIKNFEVEIYEDPFELLLSKKKELIKDIEIQDEILIKDYIILPLYSPSSNKVEKKSGLNMWNAKGRKRNPNEVYISIPRWIHEKKNDFFEYLPEYRDDENRKYNSQSFNVKLPNGKILSMKTTQQGGKALQSNPNKALGKWILRDVLELKEQELVTKEILDRKGIDSVKLSKIADNLYYLDFLKVGSYEDYQEYVFSEE